MKHIVSVLVDKIDEQFYIQCFELFSYIVNMLVILTVQAILSLCTDTYTEKDAIIIKIASFSYNCISVFRKAA